MKKKMSEFTAEKDKHETSFRKRNDELEAKRKNLQEKFEQQVSIICAKKKDVAELKDLISKQKYTSKDKQALLEKKEELQRNLELKKSQVEALTVYIDPYDKQIMNARKLVSTAER